VIHFILIKIVAYTMSKKQTKFFKECPAWARALGITSLKEWNIAAEVTSFEWFMRFDRLDELKADGTITDTQRVIIVRLLEDWDKMKAIRV